jgi:hypothetical protein
LYVTQFSRITAHQLLQVRTRVLNQQLRGDFERWYPRLKSAPEPVRLAAGAPGMDRSPTSALDGENERRIQETLAKLRGHLTVLLIAHRDTSLAGVDRIVRMAEGRIVGSQFRAPYARSAAAGI